MRTRERCGSHSMHGKRTNASGAPKASSRFAQAGAYLACAAKSDAVYKGFGAATADIRRHGSLPVPLHLRNAPTSLMRELGHGRSYRHAHDEPEGYAAGETYLPERLAARRYYTPVARGLEIRIAEKLARLRELDRAAQGRSRKGNRDA